MHFPRYWPIVRGIHRSPVNSPHNGKWRGDVFVDLHPNKWLSIQPWGFWFETSSHQLWRHCDVKRGLCGLQMYAYVISSWWFRYSKYIEYILTVRHYNRVHDKLCSASVVQDQTEFCQWASHKSLAWWRHQMVTFSALLALCAGNSLVSGEFPAQRPVTQSFDVFFDLRLNKRFSKQSWGWWFETLSCPLWRHRNV